MVAHSRLRPSLGSGRKGRYGPWGTAGPGLWPAPQWSGLSQFSAKQGRGFPAVCSRASVLTIAIERSSLGNNAPYTENDRRWVRVLFKPGRIPRAVQVTAVTPARSRAAISSSKEELFLATAISWPGRSSSSAALRSLKPAFQTVSSLPKCGSKRRNRTALNCGTRLNATQNLVSLSMV